MNRTRQYWYFFVQRMIERYPNLDNGLQEAIAMNAISEAIETVKTLPDGNERIMLIDMVYWRKNVNRVGASMRLHISERTARRWDTSFVKMVGRNMGFKER